MPWLFSLNTFAAPIPIAASSLRTPISAARRDERRAMNVIRSVFALREAVVCSEDDVGCTIVCDVAPHTLHWTVLKAGTLGFGGGWLEP